MTSVAEEGGEISTGALFIVLVKAPDSTSGSGREIQHNAVFSVCSAEGA